MKNLWILMVGLLVVGCGIKPVVYELPAAPGFRMTDKTQIISLEAADKFLIEDDSDSDSTQYTTLDDINTYLGSIYQPLTAHLTDLADGNITSNFANETYPWADNEVADDLTIAKLQLDHNVETLAANKTLAITDKVIQKLDPDGTDRDVLLPAEATATDLVFFIYNMGGEVGEDLNIQDDAAVDILSVGYVQLALCTCDGTTWVVRCIDCAGAGDVVDLRAKEENTSAIVTGQPVYISGATGVAYPNIGLADCDDSSKIRVKGLAAEDISQNSTGNVRTKGLLEDVNSTKGSPVNPLSQDWTANNQLWVSATTGGLTNVRPIGRSIKAGTALTVEGSNSKILVYPRENSIYTGAASGEDIIRQMGDSAGANKISYTDFAGNEVASLDSDGNATFTENVSAATYGSDSSITDAELLYINTLTSNAQDQFDARCLESVFGISLKDRLALNGTALDVSAVLEKYHGIDPSADVLILLGSANNTIILSNIGAEIGADVQAYDADLTTYAGITPSSDVQTMLASANNTVIISNIGAESDLVNKTGLYAALADASHFYESGDNVTTHSGTTPPTTCATGQFFCDTDEDTDGSLLLCVSTNTWKDIGMGPDKDKIVEGDSSWEIIDIGTGRADCDIDGQLKARINGAGLDVNGTITADGYNIDATASPRVRALDSGCPGTDKFAGSIDWNYIDGGDGAENSGIYIKSQQGGANTTHIQYTPAAGWEIPNGKNLALLGGSIAGRIPIGSDITASGNLTTTDLHGKFYIVTAACTVELDKVTDAGFGASVLLYIRDAAETCIVEVDDADKINLHGTPLDAGDTIDSPGNAGDYVSLISHTNVDGSGTDGWIVVGYGRAVWTDGGAT